MIDRMLCIMKIDIVTISGKLPCRSVERFTKKMSVYNNRVQ